MSLDSVFHESFCDQTLYEIYSGCLCYESRLQSQHQRQLIMSIYSSSIFFIAGKEIIFGTNLPDLVNIFLPYEYANTLTTSELYQLQGRVGRNGISNFASIMTNDDQTLYKLLSCEDIFEKENIVEQKLKALEL
jgi:RecG-like helicase